MTPEQDKRIAEIVDRYFNPMLYSFELCTNAVRAALSDEILAVAIRRQEREKAADICHTKAMEAFTEREAQRNGDFDYCSISEETGRYEGCEECENAIRAMED